MLIPVLLIVLFVTRNLRISVFNCCYTISRTAATVATLATTTPPLLCQRLVRTLKRFLLVLTVHCLLPYHASVRNDALQHDSGSYREDYLDHCDDVTASIFWHSVLQLVARLVRS